MGEAISSAKKSGMPVLPRGADGGESAGVHAESVLKLAVCLYRVGAANLAPTVFLVEDLVTIIPAVQSAQAIDATEEVLLSAFASADTDAVQKDFTQSQVRLGLLRAFTDLMRRVHGIGEYHTTAKIHLLVDKLYGFRGARADAFL